MDDRGRGCVLNARLIAYETDQTMSEAEYDRLDFPYNQLVFTAQICCDKDGTVSAGQVKEKLAEDIEKCDFRIPEKNNGISLVVPTEKRISGENEKRNRSSKWLSRNRKRKMEFCLYSFESKINRKRISKYPWKESAINFRQSSMYYNRNTVFTYAVGLKRGRKRSVYLLEKESIRLKI